MNRLATALALAISLVGLSAAQTTDKSATPDKAAAYYNFAMGHLYAELAGVYGNRGDYVSKAIEHYKAALKADPSASFLFEELTDLYIQSGRLRDAVTEAEDLLKQNPDNLDARRLLGRIYMRMAGDTQQGKVNEEMLRRATEQYQKITSEDPKDVDSWLTLGRLYRASSDSVNAEKAYSQALALDPNNEDALTGLAIVYSDVGDTKKAIEKLRALSDRNPNPRTLAALASSYEQLRDWKSAAEVLKRAVASDPDNSRLVRSLAQDLMFAEQYDDALKYYDQLAQDEPRDPQLQLRISEIYREKHNYDKARAALAKAKELDPDGIEVRYDEVNLLEAEGKTDQAITGLKSLLDETAKKSYSPAEKANRAMLLERLGILYSNAGQFQQAVDAFQQVPDLDPEAGARIAVRTVDAWRAAKDFQKAQQVADAALKKYPQERMIKMAHASLLADMGKINEAAAEIRSGMKGDRETQIALAQIYEKGKRFTDMAQALDQAEKLSKTDQERATVYFMRGAMYERTKQYDAAETEFRKVLAVDADNASALNYLGYMFADRNVRLEEAQKLISRALELDPENGAYLDSLGWVYYRQNRLPEAEGLFLKALDRIGKDPTVHDHLGDCYFKQGKTREAITQWQASLQEWDSSSQSDMDPGEVAKVKNKLESARVRLAKETSAK
ncbi:MAG TPA: tetratricopeptide repeat protein [Bryobacteraceae bacterium]|nr:tetratricopeptide repeat protein [Bryobacteraceae bacterium]